MVRQAAEPVPRAVRPPDGRAARDRARARTQPAHGRGRAAGAPLNAKPGALSGPPELVERLAEDLGGSALQSLLMEVFRRRSRAVAPASLLARLDGTPAAPCTADARALHRLEGIALEAARGFDALDLSPVAPLGTCAALGGVDQNNVLTALRSSEVMADPTAVLAVEAARRRRRGTALVRLCARARAVRMQPLDNPAFSRHFLIFAMVSAGRLQKDDAFEAAELLAQLRAWVRLVRSAAAAGYRCGEMEAVVTDTRVVKALLEARGVDVDALRRVAAAHRVGAGTEWLRAQGVVLPETIADPRGELGALLLQGGTIARAVHGLERLRDRVLAPLAAEDGIRVRLDAARVEGLGYYAGPCFRLLVTFPGAGALPLVDGGVTEWTARMLGDRKERLLTSGGGLEMLWRLAAPEAS